jgi:diguanylate cyclase (GGDEF)-like protein
MTASTDRESLVKAFDAGADDFIAKPINLEVLLARLRAGTRITGLQADLAKRNREILLANAKMAVASRDLEVANRKLRVLATTDELTGFLNRREAMNRLSRHWSASERHGGALSVIALDIDRFKLFNDTYGHAVGDVVLREMTKSLSGVARNTDELCRVGGEEFLVICPDTARDAASIAAERFRAAVERNVVEHGGDKLQVTISLGVAEKSKELSCIDELLLAADEALYQAKAAGRNCVRLAQIGAEPALP